MRFLRLAQSVFLACCLACLLAGCTQGQTSSTSDSPYTTLVSDFRNTDLGCGWQPTASMDLQYARCFTIDYYDGDYTLACLADGSRYLIVPEGATVPSDLAADITILQQPASDIYLVASDTMCLFDALNALDCISVSGIAEEDWYLPEARQAMAEGRIAYGGKYSAPDYELLTAKGVRLAIQSTMINHTPEVREKLIELGIPVLTEFSSYETEPLGRAEWIRLYGTLCDKDALAQAVFQEQVTQVNAARSEPTNKTVAFFYLNANGAAVVRRPGDYVTKMIEQAGGTYAFNDLDEATTGSSTMTLQMEQFYATAKDADIIIYNGSIDNSVDSMDDLLAKNELLADFKAVREGNVWVTNQNMYQQMVETGSIISDFSKVFHGATEELAFVKPIAR